MRDARARERERKGGRERERGGGLSKDAVAIGIPERALLAPLDTASVTSSRSLQDRGLL